MTIAVSAVAITGIVWVNSRFHGSFLVGLFLIVLPVLVLSYGLPRILPVRCRRCGGRMRLRSSSINDRRQLFAYVCDRCQDRYQWEGVDSGPTLGS